MGDHGEHGLFASVGACVWGFVVGWVLRVGGGLARDITVVDVDWGVVHGGQACGWFGMGGGEMDVGRLVGCCCYGLSTVGMILWFG